MFRNYLLIILRSIRRQKLFSLINLGGLSIGLCATMLIVLYVTDELRYDNFHEVKNRIYRIGMWSKSETGIHYSAQCPYFSFR